LNIGYWLLVIGYWLLVIGYFGFPFCAATQGAREGADAIFDPAGRCRRGALGEIGGFGR
jgi:hypothetical protein